MNQRLWWTTAALLSAVLGTPSISCAFSRPAQSSVSSMAIARVQPFELQGKMAATLFVRNVPVLTFVGSQSVATNNEFEPSSEPKNEFQKLNAPIWRATAVAAKLNHLTDDNASTIRAVWEPGSTNQNSTQQSSDRYLIKVKDQVLVEINSETRLPDTLVNPAKDALQATNRLRQLIGNAPPLREISGRQVTLPKDKFLPEISFGPIGIRLSGWASWYSFNDNGSQTASGENFNENELTAAHRDLPFGTKVLVTNLQNGRSVTVRITDRGPYVEGRIIDLSAAAAGLIGMLEPGVAPVHIDVLSQQAKPAVVVTRPNNGQD